MIHTKFICVVVTLLSAFVATVKAGEWIREQDRFPYALVQEPAAPICMPAQACHITPPENLPPCPIPFPQSL